MFKNLTIMILAIILLIILCNSSFGSMNFNYPRHSTETRIEQRLMDVARLIEDAKTDKILRSKVEKVLQNWE